MITFYIICASPLFLALIFKIIIAMFIYRRISKSTKNDRIEEPDEKIIPRVVVDEDPRPTNPNYSQVNITRRPVCSHDLYKTKSIGCLTEPKPFERQISDPSGRNVGKDSDYCLLSSCKTAVNRKMMENGCPLKGGETSEYFNLMTLQHGHD